MFDSILDGATKFLSGGALGVVGALSAGVINLFKAKQKGKKEVDILKAKLAIAEKCGPKAAKIIQSVDASYNHDKASYGGGWADDVRAMVRPSVIWYLVLMTSIIAIWSFWKVGIDTETTKLIAKKSIFECLVLTGIAVGWYFGGRDLRK